MQKSDAAERAASYAIGSGGVAGGAITWSGMVDMASDLTTIIGLVTALLGCIVVGLRLYRDMKPAKRKGRT